MVWERWSQSGRNVKPKVSLRKGGQIGINNSGVKDFELKKFKYVVLFIDKDSYKIGIKLTNDESEEGIRKLKITKFGAVIGAKNFFEHHELEKIKKRQLECAMDNKEGMLVAKFEK